MIPDLFFRNTGKPRNEDSIALPRDQVLIDVERGILGAGSTKTVETFFSVYRIPEHIRKTNEHYYEPRLVSVGPYHQGKPHLRAMEEHKWRYLRDFLSESAITREDYINNLRQVETLAREKYFEGVSISSDEFIKMLLLDGCFIIELLIKFKYEERDPVFNVGWTLPLILSDLIMQENQIPFFILTCLYQLYSHDDENSPDRRKPTLIELVTELLTRIIGEKNKVTTSVENIQHLLHFYYLFFVPKPKAEIQATTSSYWAHLKRVFKKTSSYWGAKKLLSFISCHASTESCQLNKKYPRMIPCATELQEFGVTFKKKNDTENFLDVTFERGVLNIPCTSIEESTKSVYMNLIAFEQCSDIEEKNLTSYVVLMDRLISTGNDVKVLQRSGVIENKLSSEKEVAKFFNQLSTSCYLDFEKHYLAPVFGDVKRYCEAYWPKHRAKFSRDYFSSPWSMFSLGAALLVISITIFRAICFILTDLFHHKL